MSGPSDPLRVGSSARYEILERLGSGAHGEGYLAQRLSDGGRVFLKVLKPELSDDGEWAKRFCDEVALLRACVHPNIVRYVEAYRQETGQLCLVTEYLEGEDLKARLRKSGALPPRHVLSLALPLCNALEFLHGREVVHRDLTPENVFVSGRFPDVVPRLLDFGLAWSAGARQAKTGASLALTPLYAAPECLEGARATAASDIYSLGVILFEALSGAPPFAANTVDALLERQREGKLAPLPETSATLLPVLRRCLALRPEDRWASAGELAGALQAAVDQTPSAERSDALKVKPAAQPGSLGTIGNYELVRELGKGGMGAVYLARHARLGRQVAIKMLHADAMKDRDAVARFFNEARTVNAINHEHIVEIFDFVEEDGPNARTYCVMELLVGSSLSQLRKRAPLPLRRLLHICRQVADALAAAHRAGVVHRDIKPANIFVTTRSGLTDFVKVLDFGVAKVNLPLPGGEETPSINTQTGLALGTPDYMSPEQVTAAPVDGRTDVFALGVMIYELLAGFRPFVGANVAHLVVKVVREPHTPLPEQSAGGEPIPAALARLVNRCLEKKREDRPQTMEEISATLEKILHDLAVPAAVPSSKVIVSAAVAVPETKASPAEVKALGSHAAKASVAGVKASSASARASAAPEVKVAAPPTGKANTAVKTAAATEEEAATQAQPSDIAALAPALAPSTKRTGPWSVAVGVGVLVFAAGVAVTSLVGGNGPTGRAAAPTEAASTRVNTHAAAALPPAVAQSAAAESNTMAADEAAASQRLNAQAATWHPVNAEPTTPSQAASAQPATASRPVNAEPTTVSQSATAQSATASQAASVRSATASQSATAQPATASQPASAQRAEASPPLTAQVATSPQRATTQGVTPAPGRAEGPLAQRSVALRVVSTPAGATVIRADSGERLGTTPLSAEVPFSQQPITLRVQLDGYAVKETTLAPNRAVEVSLALTRAPAPKPAPSRKTTTRSKRQKEDPDAPLDPFAQ